jgi:hypothetical protein
LDCARQFLVGLCRLCIAVGGCTFEHLHKLVQNTTFFQNNHSYWLFTMCSAYSDCGLFVVIYFWYSRMSFLVMPVWPMYTPWQTRCFMLYIPLVRYLFWICFRRVVQYYIACALFRDRKSVLRSLFVNIVETFLIIDLVCITCKVYEIEPVW